MISSFGQGQPRRNSWDLTMLSFSELTKSNLIDYHISLFFYNQINLIKETPFTLNFNVQNLINLFLFTRKPNIRISEIIDSII